MSADITVSERAARRIGEILKGEPSGTMLRVSVEGGVPSLEVRHDAQRLRVVIKAARSGKTFI